MEINNNMQLVVAMNYREASTEAVIICWFNHMIAKYRGSPSAGYVTLITERYKGRKTLTVDQIAFYDKIIADFEAHWFL